MENFSGLTPEEEARLLELEKSVELDKTKPVIKDNFLSFVKYVWPEFIEGGHHKKINKKFDLIIFQNSFAHNPNPKKLLFNIKKLMHNDSTLIIQTSQADMCKNMEFDTVYHEHINFFNVNSMDKLLKRVNLKLHYVTKKPIHGSSYLFVIKFKSNQKRIEQITNDEKFLKYKYYNKWGINCLKSVRKIKTKIDNLKKNNIVVGYGAAAKANTFINFSRVKFDFIIDDNKFKQNKFCPGSKIPIRSINALSKIEQNLVIVPLAWNFYSEIKSKVIKLRKNKKDKIIKHHSFLWLSLLDRKIDGKNIQRIIYLWTLKYSNFKNKIWENSILSSRVISWMLNIDIIINNGTFDFKKKVFQNIIYQCNHLRKNIRYEFVIY